MRGQIIYFYTDTKSKRLGLSSKCLFSHLLSSMGKVSIVRKLGEELTSVFSPFLEVPFPKKLGQISSLHENPGV